jgi:bis(5'-nucleosyl)-tetraphosphatase (symmetrical)
MRGHYRGARTIGLDSACVYGGRLTAWCVDDDRVASVPCRVPRGYLI